MIWDQDSGYMWADAGVFSARVERTPDSRYFWVVCAEGRTLETGYTLNELHAVSNCEFAVDGHRALWNMPLTPDPHQKAIES